MKAYKKVISLLLTVLMLLSCFAVGAGAASWGLTEILEDYQEADATYYEPFDTEDAVTDFGTVNSNGTLSYDSENGRLHIEKAATGEAKIAKLTKELSDALTTSDSRLCYFEFDTFGTEGAGNAEYTLTGASTQVWFLINWSNGAVSSKNRTSGTARATEVDKTKPHNVKILLDYETDLFYVWIDNGAAPVIDGKLFYREDNGYSTTKFEVATPSTTAAGDLYIDNFTITPMEEKVLMTEATGTYLYQENFDSYTTGNINDTITQNPEDTLNNLANAGGVLDTSIDPVSSSNYASYIEGLWIEEEGTDDKALKLAGEDYKVNNYFYSNDDTYKNGIGEKTNLVVQVRLKFDSIEKKSMYVNLGNGKDTAAKVWLYIYNGDVSVYNGSTQTSLDYVWKNGEYHTITYLLDKSTGTNGKFSVWIDNKLLCENFECRNSITGGFPNSISFRRGSTSNIAYVDDIRVFVPSESFLNVLNMSSSVTELADVCSIGEDSAPTDLLSADAIKTAAGLSGNTTTTVTFDDSGDYVDGENIIFPLYADTADIRVKIQDGDWYTVRRFRGVDIQPAYSNIAKAPAGTVNETENFAAGTITADVRNSASNIAGRIKVLAAVFDGNDGLIKVQMQNDVFADGAIDCVMDLSDVDIPEDAAVKLFIWDGVTLTPLA